MNKKEYDENHEMLKRIQRTLREENLTPEQRAKFESLASGFAGRLLHVWFPVNWLRRTMMGLLAMLGIYGITVGNVLLSLSLLFALLFSPRLAGETLNTFRKLARVLRGAAG